MITMGIEAYQRLNELRKVAHWYIACSDISGPPTLRAGIPTANPSSYIGSSTGIGTPVAIAICIPLFLILGRWVFDL